MNFTSEATPVQGHMHYSSCGGLSNQLYYCSLPSSRRPRDSEPTCVLLRIYGQVHSSEALESIITESVIFTLLSERNLGPALYGVFPGGRIEEYIEGRPLQNKELQNPVYSSKIAKQLAVYHSIKVPIGKKPKFFWNLVSRYVDRIQHDMRADLVPEDKRSFIHKFNSYQLEKELEWLRHYLVHVQSPVVFSHNDLQEGNILLRQKSADAEAELFFIDFEFASYNYSGFDISNHFCEWMYDYSSTEPPYFTANENNFPTQEQQISFFRSYLNTLEKQQPNGCVLPDAGRRSAESLLREVQVFTLGSHFMYGLWAIANALVSKIQFGYWEYADTRLEAYFKQKKRALGEA